MQPNFSLFVGSEAALLIDAEALPLGLAAEKNVLHVASLVAADETRPVHVTLLSRERRVADLVEWMIGRLVSWLIGWSL